jgi:hypothetical protein
MRFFLFVLFQKMEVTMIINAQHATQSQRFDAAIQIAALSTAPGSSLLSRTSDVIINELASGSTFVKICEGKIFFTVAFEKTDHVGYVEVGMTCNLAPRVVRGKDLFSQIITHYRTHNGNGEHILYLTTNDIRMITIAQQSGFTRVKKLSAVFPQEVITFCCTPCPIEKTGARVQGHQVSNCPRFNGTFMPENTSDLTRFPCMIFAQSMR